MLRDYFNTPLRGWGLSIISPIMSEAAA